MEMTFFDGHDELYHHAKFGEDRTTRAGCRCENVVFVTMFVTGRMSRSGKLPVLFLLTGQKSGFSPRRGDSLHRFRWNFARPTGTWVRLAVQDFTSIGAEGWQCGPQNIKNFHFLVKSRPAGATHLADFENFLGLLYARLSYVNISNFMWFASQVTEFLRRNRASVN